MTIAFQQGEKRNKRYRESGLEEIAIPAGRNCARVTGIRRNFFVEFEFYAGDPTLRIELILPLPAFHEFCSVNDVKMLATVAETVTQYEQLCWRYGIKPGRPDDAVAR